jgi:alpha-2-macroglobulin
MKPAKVLPILLLLPLAPLGAQAPSAALHVYRLHAAEAEALYRQGETAVSEAIFHTLIDTFSADSAQERSRPPGHYLLVQTQGENLALQLHSIYRHQLVSLNDGRDLRLRLADAEGQSVADARIWLDKRRIPYDADAQAYRLKRWNKAGFLRIEQAGDTIFYDLERELDDGLLKRRWQHFRRSPGGYVLTTPIRLGERSYRFFRRGFRGGGWRLRSNAKPPGPQQGYLALHQPRYQPGDTLKLAAFVTKHNGKPWRKDLQVFVLDRREGKAYHHTELRPDTPGVVVCQWALTDSLTLDREYQVVVKSPRIKHRGQLRQAFRYEDYQLREAVYRFSAAAERFTGAEPMVLLAEGEDHNGLPLLDAEIKVILLSGRITDCYAQSLWVPDTLWIYRTDLRVDGPTQIAVPDSVLPHCTAELQAHAFFIDSKGELHEKQLRLDYSRPPLELRLRLERDSLVAEALEDGKPVARSARLYANLRNQARDAQGREVQLPWREPISPYVEEYRLRSGEQTAAARFSGQYGFGAEVQLSARLGGDTLYLVIENPRRLQLDWQVQTRQGVWAEGHTAEPVFARALPGARAEGYFAQCRYVWGGRPQRASAEVQPYKKLLNIALEQPEKVYPGQSELVKITATDYRQRPAAGVHLAAGAVNAQFEEGPGFKAPDISFRPARKPLVFNRFQLNPHDARFFRAPLDTIWYRRLGLEEELFYRLRYLEQGSYWQYDSIAVDTAYRRLALFAPYVVKQGQAQPIYLIYCNRELVYYYDTDHQPPYSFVGRSGYNRITLRTREREYEIDSVLLKPGWKLEFSIDEDYFAQGEPGRHIAAKAMLPYLSEGEKELLARSIFVLRNPEGRGYSYLWDWRGRISRFRGAGRMLKLGPFLPYSPLEYQVQGGFRTLFTFEPGFSYALYPQQQRLYEHRLFAAGQKAWLPRSLPVQRPGQLPLLRRDIERTLVETTPLKTATSTDQVQRGRGRYFFRYKAAADSLALGLVVLVKDDTTRTLYRGSTRVISKLEPGAYRLLLFARNGAVHRRDIHIRAAALRFEDLSAADFAPDTAAWGILGLETELPPPAPEAQPNPYREKGRLISGRILEQETGEPLIGASIHLVGTPYGTTTDLEGYYELWVPDGPYELAISYVGFAAQQVSGYGVFGGGDVLLSPGGVLLSEVAVVSYEDIRNLPTRNINALSAVAAGISGEQGGIIALDRKVTSYYLDGIRVENETLDSKLDLGDFMSYAGGGRFRADFRDHAWWQPHLRTGRQGEAYFQVTYPDNLTAWRTFAVGQDRRARGGVARGLVRAYQPLAAQLALPRFLIAGDEAEVVGRAANYTGDTLQLRTYFEQDGQRVQERALALAAGHAEKLRLEAPANADSLRLGYGLELEGFTDGERRSIPIFPRGTRETVGQFLLLEGDTALELQFDPRYGAVQFYAQDNLLASLLEAADQLAGYPYGCNEQLASRLIALLLQRDIRRQLGEPFTGEGDIRDILARLRHHQSPAGYWGWWPQGARSNWISLHVLRALQMASAAGYPSPALEQGLRFLTSQLEGLRGIELLEVLLLLSEAGQQLDYARYAEPLDTLPLPLLHRLQLIRLRQENGLPYALDSLDYYRQQSLLGGHFWGERARHLRYNTTQPTLEAYRILRHEGDAAGLRAIRQYFLETREASGFCAWRNTYETASVLATILPDILQGAASGRKALASRLRLSGAGEGLVEAFPHRASLSPERPLRLEKSGAGPVFATVYQQFQNEAPEAKADVFLIHTYLEQDGYRVDDLRQGERAFLVAEVEIDVHAEYVALEIPIPAGCSYGAKSVGRSRYEVHREYFRQHAAVFCESLPPGKHVFRIELEPRFAGRYALNPARAELMYFPTFFGRNGLRVVGIGGDE